MLSSNSLQSPHRGGGEAKESHHKNENEKKNTQKKTWTQLKRPRDNLRQRRRITQSKSKTRNYNGHRHCNLRNNVGYQVKTRFLSSLGSFVQSFSKKATTLWSSRFCGRRPNKRREVPSSYFMSTGIAASSSSWW